jgi:hypothetical protein
MTTQLSQKLSCKLRNCRLHVRAVPGAWLKLRHLRRITVAIRKMLTHFLSDRWARPDLVNVTVTRRARVAESQRELASGAKEYDAELFDLGETYSRG